MSINRVKPTKAARWYHAGAAFAAFAECSTDARSRQKARGRALSLRGVLGE